MTQTTSSSHPIRGAALLMVALLLFSLTDTSIKYLSLSLTVPFIVAVRYVINCLLLVALAGPLQRGRLFRTTRTPLVWVRGFSLVASSLFVGLALQRMPVAESTALFFLAPMVVMLIAGPLLGEQVQVRTWVCGAAGFAGVLLIVRPGAGVDMLGVLYGMAAVVTLAVYQLLSRVLVRTESTLALLFYTTLAGALSFGAALPWIWPSHPLGTVNMALLVFIGSVGGVGHYFFTAAFRHASASHLAPLTYVQMVWAILLGWLVFAQIPDLWSMLGMMVVVVSGVWLTLPAGASRKAPPKD
jgi:drug/metabolite transporter (DMT)-like permease